MLFLRHCRGYCCDPFRAVISNLRDCPVVPSLMYLDRRAMAPTIGRGSILRRGLGECSFVLRPDSTRKK
jgi:hypothetical protein